ncbi:MAG: prenyltransferase, partial [Alphaproteobacteria bacterium]
HGCRCVSDQPWIPVAESCELVLALLTTGQAVLAMELFSWVHKYRHASGAYWMGYQIVENVPWPEEMPAWTAGAVLLAADALCGVTAASNLFIDVLDEDTAQQAKRFYHR